MIHVLSPRRGPLCRSSGCGCDHRDVSYHRNHLADETTDCRWRNYRPGNTPYNSMSYKTSVVYDNLYLLQLFYLGLLQIGLKPSILYNSVHLYKIIFCIYKVLLKYVYIQSTITYHSSSGSFAVETIFHGLQFVARPLFYARPKLRTISIVGQVITANSLRSLQKKSTIHMYIQAKLHRFGTVGIGSMNSICKGMVRKSLQRIFKISIVTYAKNILPQTRHFFW